MTIKPGTPVEILGIVASGGVRGDHLYAWLTGYTLVGYAAQGAAILRITGGTFEGCEVLYPVANIRPAKGVDTGSKY